MKPTPRALVPRPLAPRQIAQARRPIDHHFAHVMLRRPHHSVEPRRSLSARRQPFRARARLTRATTTLKQPRRPLSLRRTLRLMRDLVPQAGKLRRPVFTAAFASGNACKGGGGSWA